MSQRVDERKPTKLNLDAYNKFLKLSDHVLSVCKPKDKNVNDKHIPKRNASIGKMMMDAVVEIGCDILEANEIYVGGNLDIESRIENYKERIKLQEHAKRMTYRVENIFRILHFDKPFAESTSKYMMDLICETRQLLTNWRESEIKDSKSLQKSVLIGER